MTTETTKHYLFDLGHLLKEAAREAAHKVKTKAVNQDEMQFAKGRLMAYYEVITLMQSQGKAFQITLDALNLCDIDPDAELLG